MAKYFALAAALIIGVPASYAQTAPPTATASPAGTTSVSAAPSEVGTTTMPAGQYIVTEQSSGQRYSLTVTNKGTMILGAAPPAVSTSAASTAPGGTINKTGLLESAAKAGMEKGVSGLVKSQGEKELGNFFK